MGAREGCTITPVVQTKHKTWPMDNFLQIENHRLKYAFDSESIIARYTCTAISNTLSPKNDFPLFHMTLPPTSSASFSVCNSPWSFPLQNSHPPPKPLQSFETMTPNRYTAFKNIIFETIDPSTRSTAPIILFKTKKQTF